VHANAWKRSHHALGQTRATSVPGGEVGDFRVTSDDAGVRVWWRELDGGSASGAVRFTLGVEPLVQLAVDRQGSLQVPPLGLLADGGWFRVPGLSGAVGDWTTPSFNWNGSCAPCHATGLRVRTGQARSLAVTCTACHGESHDAGVLGHATRFEFVDGGAIARAVSPPRPDLQSLRCAECHSRRRALSDDGQVDGEFFDRFEPGLIRAGLYRPGGAVQDEVYEVGSFLMSKMERSGVRCSHCHDLHSGSLRAEGNALCTRCHRASVFDVDTHHAAGARCVDCHMPTTTFLGVDVRHDHSFPVPGREDHALSEAFTAGFTERADARRRLLAVVERTDVSSFQRASALALLPFGQGVAEAIRAGAASDDDWLRSGAALAAGNAPPALRRELIGHLLHDRRRAIRVQAARVLVGTGPVPPEVLAEAEAAERANDFRGDAFLNLGAMALARGDASEAEKTLREGLRRDPTFAPLTINLADVLRREGRDGEGLALLEHEAPRAGPWVAPMNYALGLARWRAGSKAEALVALEAAAEDGSPTHRTAWLAAVREVQGPERAWEQLERLLRATPDDQRLLAMAVDWATLDHDLKKARAFSARLEP
jgi:predicted CXXCH cytochrome family protein